MVSIPIWIHDGQTPPPEKSVYYILAANGMFIRKRMQYWDTTVPVERMSTLQEIPSPKVELYVPPIPEKYTQEMVRFFAWVYAQFGTEAVILVFINEADKTYRLDVPLQTVTSGNISRYEIPNANPGESLIGTFHSHGSMSAFHSGTDTCDEAALDGFHGTFGGFYSRHQRHFELSVQAAMNGQRFVLKPEEMLEGLEQRYMVPKYSWYKKEPEPVEENPEDISEELDQPVVKTITGTPLIRPTGYWSGGYESKSQYVLADNEPLLTSDYVPPEEWKNNIRSARKYTSFLHDLVSCRSEVASGLKVIEKHIADKEVVFATPAAIEDAQEVPPQAPVDTVEDGAGGSEVTSAPEEPIKEKEASS